MHDRTAGGEVSPPDRNPAQPKEDFERRLRDVEAALAAEQARGAQLLDARQRAEFRSASLFRQLAETEDRLAQEKDRLADVQRRAEQLEERIGHLEQVIRDIHASTSWKASYPIRWLKRLVRS
jgi:septal ring factor EnvC (AmiA/AmiB activator)